MINLDPLELRLFDSVGPLRFEKESDLPAALGGSARVNAPGGDRCIYGEAEIVVFWDAEGYVEMIGVDSPLQVVISGERILRRRKVNFPAVMDRLGIAGGFNDDGWWESKDGSFSVNFRGGSSSDLTAYSSRYVERYQRMFRNPE